MGKVNKRFCTSNKAFGEKLRFRSLNKLLSVNSLTAPAPKTLCDILDNIVKKKKAHQIEIFDVIIYKQKPFVVWDIDKFYKNDEVAKKYNDQDDVDPEDTLYTFYHETGIDVDGLIETVIEYVSFEKEFYFIGPYRPEFEEQKDKRNVSKSLRFKILVRDEFKCVLCGRGSVNNVQLHIDHIVPHSLGGKTIESNLQTLCIDCNLGKKNRIII